MQNKNFFEQLKTSIESGDPLSNGCDPEQNDELERIRNTAKMIFTDEQVGELLNYNSLLESSCKLTQPTCSTCAIEFRCCSPLNCGLVKGILKKETLKYQRLGTRKVASILTKDVCFAHI
jgi:hypothetical protein